jgi:Leishmanolysin
MAGMQRVGSGRVVISHITCAEASAKWRVCASAQECKLCGGQDTIEPNHRYAPVLRALQGFDKNHFDGWLAAGPIVGTDRGRQYIVTPMVRDYVQRFFNCCDVPGAELEDDGGHATAGSHWEARIFEVRTDSVEHSAPSVCWRRAVCMSCSQRAMQWTAQGRAHNGTRRAPLMPRAVQRGVALGRDVGRQTAGLHWEPRVFEVPSLLPSTLSFTPAVNPVLVLLHTHRRRYRAACAAGGTLLLPFVLAQS